MEKRYINKQGHVVWVTLTASAVPDALGKVSYGVAQAQDITARKHAEAALRRDQEQLQSLAGRLITVQEEERKRIARELHDDINQRLALLAVNLGDLRDHVPASATELKRGVETASKLVTELVNDVQALSHRLHSSRLQHLGLESAAASLCREFSERNRVEIEFSSDHILEELPEETSLCLYRVLQEALQNAIKHSGSRNLQVSLTGRTSEIELTVCDSGIGFYPEEAMKGRGLGLTSIRERLKLVNGILSIESQPQRGTKIHAQVPFSSGEKSVTASA